jgi:ribosome biogenesis ATPase
LPIVGNGGNGVSERVVNQLLTELDGLESRKDVYIIAATNRLELIDDAMLRPGRLGNLLYVPLPTPYDRVSILQALTRKVAVEYYSENEEGKKDGVNLQKVAFDERCEGFSGADLAALVREAGLSVIKEISARAESTVAKMDEQIADGKSTELTSSDATVARIAIKGYHFERAFEKIKPSVNKKDRVRYVFTL